MREFEYYEPKSVEEACRLLKEDRSKAVSGGTDLIVQIKHGVIKPKNIVNLKSLDNLSGLSFSKDGARIGALTKIADIAASEEINKNWTALAVGADKIGTPQIRNLGTIGGNICNSSPCADTVPGLLVSDAAAVITNGTSDREVPLETFFVGPGKNCMAQGEILRELFIPAMPSGTRQGFIKMGPRKSGDIAVINMAISLSFDNGICTRARIALGSVAPTPIRAKTAEAALEGSGTARDIAAISALIAKAAKPIDDVRGSASYRKDMVEAAARELLAELCR